MLRSMAGNVNFFLQVLIRYCIKLSKINILETKKLASEKF